MPPEGLLLPQVVLEQLQQAAGWFGCAARPAFQHLAPRPLRRLAQPPSLPDCSERKDSISTSLGFGANKSWLFAKSSV